MTVGMIWVRRFSAKSVEISIKLKRKYQSILSDVLLI